jgi:transcriptional regulator with GAF, ATPase, and Fis domain
VASLQIMALAGGKVVARASLSRTPFRVGSAPVCDLVLPGGPALVGQVGRGAAGQWVWRPDGSEESQDVADGSHVDLGPVTLYFAAPSEAGGLRATLLDHLLELLAAPEADDETEGLGAVLALVQQVFEASWAAILSQDSPDAEPNVWISRGERPEEAAGISRTLLQRLAETDRPLLAGGLVDDAGAQRIGSIPINVRSVLAAPLDRDGERLGLVYLESPVDRRAYTVEERQLLFRVCELVSDRLAKAALARRQSELNVRLSELYSAVLTRDHGLGNLVGESEGMREVRKQIRQVADTPTTVLVLGESGTGKELVAQAVHDVSARREAPFVALNCLALPSELAESELFGHAMGAFSGATKARPGRFELAHQGTLFLDEVGEVDLSIQGKLLRVLQERVVQRLGEARERKVDVRLVAATNVDLAGQIGAGTFREDLYYRLSVFVIRLPPLRDRGGDVRLLAEYFLPELARKARKEVTSISAAALAELQAYDWPGNVRELRNVLEQAVLRASGTELTPECFSLRGSGGGGPKYPDELEDARALFERAHIIRILRQCGGKMTAAAKVLGITRGYLYKRCHTYEIDPEEYR